VICTGDTHIYLNHIEQMKEQLNRNPLSKPKLYINPEVRDKNIDDITIEDFELIGYNSHPTIKGKMAV
jgi:thymidylate synthase